MWRILRLSIVLSVLSSAEAAALSVGYEGSTSPFQLAYHPNSEASINPVLQVINTGADTGISAWQIEFEIRPASTSVGQLLFHDVSVPSDSLFGQDPRIVSLLSEPSDAVLSFDSAAQAEGVLVAAGMAKNIIGLTLAASPDARGPFDLVMRGFSTDMSEQDNSSSWLPADSFDPVAFDNIEVDGVVLLGTINVSRPAQPGDYDRDGVVGDLDYICWRIHFGDVMTAAGDDADGNWDFTIDAADYVVWRKLTSGQASLQLVAHAVPEPGTWQFVLLALAIVSGARFCRICDGQILIPKAST